MGRGRGGQGAVISGDCTTPDSSAVPHTYPKETFRRLKRRPCTGLRNPNSSYLSPLGAGTCSFKSEPHEQITQT